MEKVILFDQNIHANNGYGQTIEGYDEIADKINLELRAGKKIKSINQMYVPCFAGNPPRLLTTYILTD